MDWDDIRHFLALARARSVRAAGAALGVSHSTVARRIEALEAQLSTRLFDRSRDGYALTEAGRKMLFSAERIEKEMSSLERGLVGRDERLAGRVAITCCDPFVSALLISALVPFFEAHPDIEPAVTVDGRLFDLSRREADIAIRALPVGTQPPGHLIGRRLAPLMLCTYVARAHAARLDPERAGSGARWLAFDERVSPQLIADSSYPALSSWGAFASLELMVQAARAGLGLAMLPTYVGDPLGDELQRLARPDLRHMADLWLVSHPDLRDNARFRATRARITAVFHEHAPLFRGDGWSAGAPGRPRNEPRVIPGLFVP